MMDNKRALKKRVTELFEKQERLTHKEKTELYVLLAELRQFEPSPVDLKDVDPISAIKLRMEQFSLKNKDLEPYIGTKGNVSEVLNKLKPLSLPMIRRLAEGLDLPLEVLAKDYELKSERKLDFTTSLIKTVYERNYIPNLKSDLNEFLSNPSKYLESLVSDELGAATDNALLRTSLHYQSEHKRSNKKMDPAALLLWQCKVRKLARNMELPSYGEKLTKDDLKDIAKLSRFKNGPQLAREELARYGIPLVLCQHLPKTYLDGAVVPAKDKTPIVALTLRHDRTDNFWFVLLHELSHIVLHYGEEGSSFIDDLDIDGTNSIEEEADKLASESIISDEDWNIYKPLIGSPESVTLLAKDLNIHPALLAGRYRKEERDYKRFSRLIGNREVRKQFEGFENT